MWFPLFLTRANEQELFPSSDSILKLKTSVMIEEKKVSCCSSENAYSIVISLAFVDGTNAEVYALEGN